MKQIYICHHAEMETGADLGIPWSVAAVALAAFDRS
jgi:hypothetical protein